MVKNFSNDISTHKPEFIYIHRQFKYQYFYIRRHIKEEWLKVYFWIIYDTGLFRYAGDPKPLLERETIYKPDLPILTVKFIYIYIYVLTYNLYNKIPFIHKLL